ncbi:hypothetical protein HGRIS_014030 [Hohenbuehelia grisea]|uniref:MFS general substrate transporter n=1 Tax=Hohenbuehelia grisea TaxID=104357 RepID=A0ABR3JSA9_9AGAR
MAGFGLSAFIYSSMARVFFPGDTSSFLLTLAIGTASPMIAGYFMIRIVPLPLAPSGTEEGALIRRVDTQDSSDSTPLLSEEVEPPQPSTDRRPSDSSHEMTGWNLTKNINFWTLFALFSILSGTGIMYINNVGTMSQILYAKSANPYRDVEAAKWQSAQVSTISVVSFLGRVCMGVFSDYLKSHLGLPRSYCLVIVTSLMLVSQINATIVDTVEHLWIVSASLGFAYGSAAAIFPILCIDWFGLAHFSEAMGYIALSPLILGNIFSVMFGRILDAHRTLDPNAMSNMGSLVDHDRPPQCLSGKGCYVQALYVTIASCFVAVALSTWAAWRDRRRLLAMS